MFKWNWNKKLNCYCSEHNLSIRADKNGNVFGGRTSIPTPETQAAPTEAQNMQDWIQNYPAMFELQQKYAPLEAQQQVELAQQYAQPLGEAYKAANEAMYPETSAIQEKLAQQALTGMESGVPDWQKAQYQSDLNANLGANVGSGIGADYVSRGMLQQQQDWQNYYRDLGLSVAGRQPLATAQTPSYSNYASTYTPSSVANTNAQNYGSYSNAYANMYGTNANYASNMFGNYLQAGQQGAGALTGMLSSIRYKTNVKLWA